MLNLGKKLRKIFMQNLNQNEQIKCPSCGSFIDISTALYAQILDKAKQEMLKQKKNLMMR